MHLFLRRIAVQTSKAEYGTRMDSQNHVGLCFFEGTFFVRV